MPSPTFDKSLSKKRDDYYDDLNRFYESEETSEDEVNEKSTGKKLRHNYNYIQISLNKLNTYISLNTSPSL